MTNRTNPTKWNIIGRGFNGWHTRGLTKYNPEDQGHVTSGSGGNLEEYVKEAAENAFVYDCDKLSGGDVTSFEKWVFTGPMFDPLTPPNCVKVTDWSRLMVKDSYVPFEEYKGKIGGMDYVGLEVWIALFKANNPNVKTGRVIGGNLVWD